MPCVIHAMQVTSMACICSPTSQGPKLPCINSALYQQNVTFTAWRSALSLSEENRLQAEIF